METVVEHLFSHTLPTINGIINTSFSLNNPYRNSPIRNAIAKKHNAPGIQKQLLTDRSANITAVVQVTTQSTTATHLQEIYN